MDLSIIIPFYNGADTIGRCLDSIYSQGLAPSAFEVICVDDKSSDPYAVKALREYKYKGLCPDNLVIIEHTTNKRQGGARNTGIKAARGEYILFIDQDDFFVDGSIETVLREGKQNRDLDFIMIDCVEGDGSEKQGEGIYGTKKLNEGILSGTEFVQCHPVPWCPWCYLYKRSFLIRTAILFAENVRFEDADFVLRCTVNARHARFSPIVTVYHVISPGQTTKIGNDYDRISDFLKMNNRIHALAEEEKGVNDTASEAIMRHFIYMRLTTLSRYVWRLSFRQTIKVLKDNHYHGGTDAAILDFTNAHPVITAIVFLVLKPVLIAADFLKANVLQHA